ncbi:unnamed protein product, partial [Rotaria sordida]
MSYGSFIVNNCCINARRNQREPRVTREWLVENTYRLAKIDNNNFSCRFDDINSFTVHLWVGEGGKQQTKLSNART